MAEAEGLRERHKRETRERLVAAGRSLYEERGYEETTVDEVAGAAGVSRATFFNYFDGKETLLVEIAAAEVRELRHLLDTRLAGVSSPVARAVRVVAQLVDDTAPNLRITRQVLLLALAQPAGLPDPVVELGAILAELACEAQQVGEIRADLLPVDVARAIIGVYMAAFTAWLAEGAPSDDTLGRKMAAMGGMLLHGIAGPGLAPVEGVG